jgi:hypothetical protein
LRNSVQKYKDEHGDPEEQSTDTEQPQQQQQQQPEVMTKTNQDQATIKEPETMAADDKSTGDDQGQIDIPKVSCHSCNET